MFHIGKWFILIDLFAFSLELCETEKEKSCAFYVALLLRGKIAEKKICPKSCTTMEFYGNAVTQAKSYSNSSVSGIWIKFDNPENVIVNQEYLIYDPVSVIGSIGGTLGMCIGFSFNNVLNVILNFARKTLKTTT